MTTDTTDKGFEALIVAAMTGPLPAVAHLVKAYAPAIRGLGLGWSRGKLAVVLEEVEPNPAADNHHA